MRIVGIILIKNEDLYIERVITNVADFCDRIIIADHQSTDHTPDILKRLAARYSQVEVHAIARPTKSHEIIKDLAGTSTWVFGVDGDEIYDPAGLRVMKTHLSEGRYDQSWAVFGNVLNCIELNVEAGWASGHLAPPCRSMTKLYNFSLIESWGGDCPQRLHGGSIRFKNGYSESLRRKLQVSYSWKESFFRCLHLCWLPRSSVDVPTNAGARRNITELNNRGFLKKIAEHCLRWTGGSKASAWKKDKYMRGDRVTENVSAFFGGHIRHEIQDRRDLH